VAFTNPVRNASEVRAGLAGLAVQANAGRRILHSL
jgi:heme iron utilization protein